MLTSLGDDDESKANKETKRVLTLQHCAPTILHTRPFYPLHELSHESWFNCDLSSVICTNTWISPALRREDSNSLEKWFVLRNKGVLTLEERRKYEKGIERNLREKHHSFTKTCTIQAWWNNGGVQLLCHDHCYSKRMLNLPP